MVRKVIIVIFSLYLLLLIGIYLFQEKIIFRTKYLEKNHAYIFEQEFEEVNLTNDDGSVINGLHFKTENSKGVILYFHGNKGNLERWKNKVAPLLTYDYDLFIIDYRGYGKSTGKRTEENMYKDAQLSYDYLLKAYSENEIVVYGRSLGGAFATYVAAQNKPKHLVLEATFSSIVDVSKGLVPIVPFQLLYKFPFESYRQISNVSISTTIFHGNNDSLVSMLIAEKLYAHANKEITKFVKIDKGTHHNLSTFNVYKDKMAELLN